MSYACAEGMHVKAFFEDTDSSAPGNCYEGLSGLLGYIKAKEPDWDYVIVYDRFSVPQDVIRYTQLIEFLESYGIILLSVKDGLGRDPDEWIDISEEYASQEGSIRKRGWERMKKTIKITRKALLSKDHKQTTVKKEGKEPERIDKETLLALIRAMKQQ